MKWYYWVLIAVIVAAISYGAYYMLKDDTKESETQTT